MLLGVLLAAVIGVMLGLLGGGGSILTLPMLAYALGQAPRVAVAGSLFVVGLTSLVGAGLHARGGRVAWRVGLLFGLGGMAGALGGGRLASTLPPRALLVGFAAMMLLAATSMLGAPRVHAPTTRPPRSGAAGRYLALGAAVGFVAGTVGAGGGFLVVPALVVVGRLPVRDAIGTSLLVIAMQSFAGFAGHAASVTLDWPMLGAVAAATVTGALAGARLGRGLQPDSLRAAFGWLVLAMGVLVLGRELPVPPAHRPLAWVLLTAGALATGLAARRRAQGRGDAGEVSPGPDASSSSTA